MESIWALRTALRQSGKKEGFPREEELLHPERCASNFKRFMGTEKVYSLADRKFTPEELSALILRRIKEDAKEYLGEEITEAVISVLAYFNNDQRYATKLAGMKNVISKAVRDSGLGLEDITNILLAGGSSRMPAVQMFLRRLFQRDVITGEEPDLLIARGLGFSASFFVNFSASHG